MAEGAVCESSVDLIDRQEISLPLLACRFGPGPIANIQVYVYTHLEAPPFWGPGAVAQLDLSQNSPNNTDQVQ